MDILSKFVEALLLALAPLLASLAAAWLLAVARKAWADFRAAEPGKSYWIEEIASIAVRAAEQAGMAGYVEDKKTYALHIAERWLAAKGLRIDLELIDAAIEAAVWEELNKDRERPPELPSPERFDALTG